ncbi:ATP-binding protein [Jannaschia seohaensis]|uniref:histidine kinase n=1 Tax=Jannaschia seohaensis TaxID=475081 RepID=A0A2Y9AF61_9RHOB|nr:ATP-binding protein [Jannaschia seohaensis]PWJ20809.1 phospho-acceptor domain-containing protein [Jannaschia seohaensis]SSA41219.1 His Kinase A (phospho-acceptor) domain-containing protein [Jannaschia seohaensis]
MLMGQNQCRGQPSLDEKATLRTLNAFAVDLISIRSAEDLFWHIAREVVGRLNFVDCVVYRLDEARGELVQAAALGDKNPHDRTIINPLRIQIGHGITGRCAQAGQPVIVDDLIADQDYILDTAPARSEISVPILSDGRVVGVLDSEHPEPYAFGVAELEILTTVAAMTGAKLELLREAEVSAERYRALVRSHSQLADETERRRKLEAELFEARRLEAIGRLTGGFAHAFNNTLTAVGGHLELAEAEGLSENAAEAVAQARAATQAGAQLIRDMLAFSRRSALSPQTLDITQLIEGARNAMSDGDRFEAEIATGVWPVRADRAAAEVALVNVLMNAVQATKAARSAAPVRIEAIPIFVPVGGVVAPTELLPGRYVRIDVIDTGNGIADELLDRVFDPFFTTKSVAENSGLGLSMVKGFMRQSGGDVAVRTNEAGGATVSLWFPAVTADPGG